MPEKSAQVVNNGTLNKEIFSAKDFYPKPQPDITAHETNNRDTYESNPDIVIKEDKLSWNSPEVKKKFVETFDLSKQPESTKIVLSDNVLKESLRKHVIEIDGKIWLFSDVYKNGVVALVNTEENPDIYRPRFFRVSSSDHQFKVHPGLRERLSKLIPGDLMKGGESSPEHHYVQSNKLHPNILVALQSLPTSNNNNYSSPRINEFLPEIISRKPFLTSRSEDFTFSEEQVNIKDQDWKMLKRLMMENFDIYSDISVSTHFSVTQLYELVNRIKKSTLNKMDILNNQNLLSLEQIYQNLSPEDKTQSFLHLINSDTASTIQRSFINGISTLFSNTIEKMMTFDGSLDVVMEKTHFVPDFSQPPVKTYQLSRGEIYVEEYDQVSSSGDHLRWAMARDKKGRVYINNIYDPREKIDDYGTPHRKANFGILVYKTEDYQSQTTFINDKYKKESDDYIDISLLMERQYPIKKYKEALEKRKAA